MPIGLRRHQVRVDAHLGLLPFLGVPRDFRALGVELPDTRHLESDQRIVLGQVRVMFVDERIQSAGIRVVEMQFSAIAAIQRGQARLQIGAAAVDNWKPNFDNSYNPDTGNPGGDGVVMFVGLAEPPRL